MTRDEIAEFNEELLMLEPSYFDKAIVGIVTNVKNQAVCYDVNKIIKILMKEDKMTEEEAREYFDFNILGAWVGEHTPVYLEKTL
jgi:hypothetical protein